MYEMLLSWMCTQENLVDEAETIIRKEMPVRPLYPLRENMTIGGGHQCVRLSFAFSGYILQHARQHFGKIPENSRNAEQPLSSLSIFLSLSCHAACTVQILRNKPCHCNASHRATKHST